MIFRYSAHPKGLGPFQAAKAWHVRVLQGMPWKDVRLLVRTVSGMHPGQDALEDAPRSSFCIQREKLCAPRSSSRILREKLHAPRSSICLHREKLYAPRSSGFLHREKLYAPRSSTCIHREKL